MAKESFSIKNKIMIESLKEVIPLEKKLLIYNKALNCLETKKYPANLLYGPLCILLPCLLWNLNSFLDRAPNGKIWNYLDTVVAFPEIAQGVKELIKLKCEEREPLRIEVIKKAINICHNYK